LPPATQFHGSKEDEDAHQCCGRRIARIGNQIKDKMLVTMRESVEQANTQGLGEHRS